MIRHYRETLDAGQQTVSPVLSNFKSKFAVDWAPFLNSKWTDAASYDLACGPGGRREHSQAR